MEQDQFIGMIICISIIFVMGVFGALYRIRLGNRMVRDKSNYDDKRKIDKKKYRISRISAFLGLINGCLIILFLSLLIFKPSLISSYPMLRLVPIIILILGLFVGANLFQKK
jgi:hypothetical protein